MNHLIKQLKNDHTHLKFTLASIFSWSPANQIVSYKKTDSNDQVAKWSLLHEVGHALLAHKTYSSDFELLKLEAQAWAKACEIAPNYAIHIDSEHVQDCLDTYRDWLHKRSTCPTCVNQSLQVTPRLYSCFNCGASWQVSAARFCRPYRKLAVS